LVLISGLVFFVLVFWVYHNFLISSTVTGENLRIVFLDVGQGDATLIQTKEKNILLDGGPDKSLIFKMDEFFPFYQRKIDLVVLSHFDLDHFIGLIEILERYQIEKIITNGLNDHTLVGEKWLALIKTNKIEVQEISQPTKINLNNYLSLDFIWPQFDNLKKLKDDDNLSSLVIKLNYGQRNFLFMGDAPKRVEQELIARKIDLKSDVLKIGHHGSKYSTGLDFLKLVNPEYGIISCGKNKFGHPSLRVLKNLKTVRVKTLRTDKKGDIIFLSDGKNLILK
jgi:competence protein ComEC